MLNESPISFSPFDFDDNSPLFILGAGFSHSYCKELFPLTNKLLRETLKKQKTFFPNIQEFINKYFLQKEDVNFEKVASFLLQNPFPAINEQSMINHFLYLELLGLVSSVLGNPNILNFGSAKNKPILSGFIDYLREKKAIIISFNYDLILENYLKDKNWNPLTGYGIDFYIPFSNRYYQYNNQITTPTILKLHGSLNWGVIPEDIQNLGNAQIYLSRETYHETISRTHFQGSFYEKYKYYPYIIPPIVGKTYEHREIRKLWHIAKHALQICSQIFVIGFSLPESDVIVEYLFRNIRENKMIINIVDPAINENKDIISRFEKAFQAEKYGHQINPFAMDAMEYIENNIINGTNK